MKKKHQTDIQCRNSELQLSLTNLLKFFIDESGASVLREIWIIAYIVYRALPFFPLSIPGRQCPPIAISASQWLHHPFPRTIDLSCR